MDLADGDVSTLEVCRYSCVARPRARWRHIYLGSARGLVKLQQPCTWYVWPYIRRCFGSLAWGIGLTSLISMPKVLGHVSVHTRLM